MQHEVPVFAGRTGLTPLPDQRNVTDEVSMQTLLTEAPPPPAFASENADRTITALPSPQPLGQVGGGSPRSHSACPVGAEARSDEAIKAADIAVRRLPETPRTLTAWRRLGAGVFVEANAKAKTKDAARAKAKANVDAAKADDG